ncbi:MAG TPA: hypothetical protein VIN40_04255 [Candidatus Tyrphobacter sp.]
MLRRVDAEIAVERGGIETLAARDTEPIAPPLLRVDPETELLPHGHPKWVKDGVSISQRARDLIARLRPVVVRVLRFWDHRVRSIVVGGRRVSVDAGGSYRAE